MRFLTFPALFLGAFAAFNPEAEMRMEHHPLLSHDSVPSSVESSRIDPYNGGVGHFSAGSTDSPKSRQSPWSAQSLHGHLQNAAKYPMSFVHSRLPPSWNLKGGVKHLKPSCSTDCHQRYVSESFLPNRQSGGGSGNGETDKRVFQETQNLRIRNWFEQWKASGRQPPHIPAGLTLSREFFASRDEAIQKNFGYSMEIQRRMLGKCMAACRTGQRIGPSVMKMSAQSRE